MTAFPRDASPYGVLGLAGNVMEWLGSPDTGGDAASFFRGTTRLTRGGNWYETPPDDLYNFMVLENGRQADARTFTIGWRCVTPEDR